MPKLSHASSSLVLFQNTGQTVERSASQDRSEETADLDSEALNNALYTLVEIFPDVEPEVFRQMLDKIGPESRAEVVTEQLLNAKATRVRERHRSKEESNRASIMISRSRHTHMMRCTSKSSQNLPNLPIEETFRSASYKTSVREALDEEFRGLSRSVINAVLAENNYAYTPSRAALLDISSRSWRVSLSNFILRRKKPSAPQHPLVTWIKPSSGVDREPRIRLTASPELNDELFETLVAPVQREQREAQEIVDHAIAARIQADEAARAEEIYDCECCYRSVPIHEIAKCDDNCHSVCFPCIRQTVKEAVYGQGWAHSIDIDRGEMPCIASSSEECKGYIRKDALRDALQDSQEGITTYVKLQERLAQDALRRSKLPLVQCPFCYYAEVDDIDINDRFPWKSRRTPELLTIFSLAFLLLLLTGILPFFVLILAILLVTSTNPARIPAIQASLHRVARRRRGLRFTCQSPTCGKPSCMRCHILWRDPHSCYSAAVDSLAKRLEAAMTAAVKRICPRCNTAFVKASGCNRLVCVCGYTMCYLCRAEITVEVGYSHFCQHFRATGGPCRDCEKCDLYRSEDEAVVIRRAREKAEQEWWADEGRGVDRTFVEETQRLPKKDSNWKGRKKWEQKLDAVIERYLA